jgi:hypothetical protein
MIPLVYFLFAWLVLVALFAIAALVTVIMALRYGLSGLLTTLTTALFLFVTFAVLVGMGIYLAGVDWDQDVFILNASSVNVLPTSL